MNFQAEITRAAEEFKKMKPSAVGIISHNDTDGIMSAAIISKALKRKNIAFQIKIISRMEDDITEYIKGKSYGVFMLLDYGSREISQIAKEIPDKNFFVLDHHELKENQELSNVVHINPHLFGIDGGSEVCASGLCYLFAKALSSENIDLVQLAITGAIGDSQRKNGRFISINQEIFEQATRNGFASTEKGLKFYGWSSRPLHKALEYSTDPFIPGVSGSESATVQLLQDIGISLKKDDDSWRTIADLTDDEKKKLATALIAQRQNIKDPGNIFEEKVILPKFEISELREAEVLSAVINSLSKKHSGLAISVALGNTADYEESQKIIQEYKKQLISALNYFYDNRKNPNVVKETGNAIYFIGGDKIDSTITGTISTILSFNLEETGKALFCFATEGAKAKISCRYVGGKSLKNVSLGDFCSKTASELGGEGGGHNVAAGANIPLGKEEMFINAFEEKMNSNG